MWPHHPLSHPPIRFISNLNIAWLFHSIPIRFVLSGSWVLAAAALSAILLNFVMLDISSLTAHTLLWSKAYQPKIISNTFMRSMPHKCMLCLAPTEAPLSPQNTSESCYCAVVQTRLRKLSCDVTLEPEWGVLDLDDAHPRVDGERPCFWALLFFLISLLSYSSLRSPFIHFHQPEINERLLRDQFQSCHAALRNSIRVQLMTWYIHNFQEPKLQRLLRHSYTDWIFRWTHMARFQHREFYPLSARFPRIAQYFKSTNDLLLRIA